MHFTFDRRAMLKGMALASAAVPLLNSSASARVLRRKPGWVEGKLTGAQAVFETLIQEGADCVYGIPGAQENELWDAMKSKGLPYLLVTHEFSAAAMADGCARSTGKAGVMCVVPGPGVTNSLTGLGEALIDSVPIVAIVGDIAQGENTAHSRCIASIRSACSSRRRKASSLSRMSARFPRRFVKPLRLPSPGSLDRWPSSFRIPC